MRRVVFTLVLAGTLAALTLGIFEAALRIRPELVPLKLLLRFEDGLAIEIAQRRGLPNRSQVRTLERRDGGPPLELFLPFSEYVLDHVGAGTTDRMLLDANGFCNPRPDGGYGAERIPLITVGDSFTWCQSLTPPQIWTYLLAERLQVPAYCLGRGGIGPYEYLEILEQFGVQKSPEIVVMNVYGGNDLRDSLRYRSFVEGAVARDASDLTGDFRAPVDNFLGRRSYAFNLMMAAAAYGLEGGMNAILRRISAQGRVQFRYEIVFPDGAVSFNPTNTDRDEVRHAAALRAGTIGLDAYDDALARFLRLAEEHGFLAVVAYTPSAHTVYQEWVRFRAPEIAEPLAAFSDAQREYFARKSQELGFVFVDVTPALRAAAAEHLGDELLYYASDLHFAPAAHVIVARELAEAIGPLRE